MTTEPLDAARKAEAPSPSDLADMLREEATYGLANMADSSELDFDATAAALHARLYHEHEWWDADESDPKFRASLDEGLADVAAGRTKPFRSTPAARPAEGLDVDDLDDMEAFVYGLTVVFVGEETARRFGAAVRARLGADRTEEPHE